MLVQLGAEIAAATKERDAAKLDESQFRSGRFGNEKIVGQQFQVRLGAMESDLGKSQIQRRIRRTRDAEQQLSALCQRLADLKVPNWRVQ